MTNTEFELAKQTRNRIEHILQVLKVIGEYEYSLDPPIRQTGVSLWWREQSQVVLNEGEVVTLRAALKNEIARLEAEFAKL